MLVSKRQCEERGQNLIQEHQFSITQCDVCIFRCPESTSMIAMSRPRVRCLQLLGLCADAARRISLRARSVCRSASTSLTCAPTHALLKDLDVLHTDANPSCASEVPTGLSRQILYHDTGQNCDLGLHVVQYAVVREI